MSQVTYIVLLKPAYKRRSDFRDAERVGGDVFLHYAMLLREN